MGPWPEYFFYVFSLELQVVMQAVIHSIYLKCLTFFSWLVKHAGSRMHIYVLVLSED